MFAQAILFTIGSVLLTAFSWRFLRRPAAHGFYRFFAFEAILGLVILNAPAWLDEPFSLRQILSWLLLLASAFLAAHGFALLHEVGKPDERRDEDLLGIEKTTQLVTVGAYRFIRHPLYASLLCLGWGAFLKDPSLVGFALATLASTALELTARVEELENIAYFGAQYREYMGKTKRFVPGVW